MKIKKTMQNDFVILSFEGDMMGGPEAVKINEEINRLLDERKLKLVVDLGNLNRMNSSGLGILINALSTFKQNGGQLKLAHPRERIKSLLLITKLDNIFDIYDSIDEALASF